MPVTFEKRLVQCHRYRRAYAHFRKVEELKQAGGSGVESENLGAKIVEENLSGPESYQQGYNLQSQRDGTVAKALPCPGICSPGFYG